MTGSSFSFPIQWPEGAPVDLLSKSTLLRWWLDRIGSKFTINSVQVSTVDVWPGPRVGFIEMDVNYSANGHRHAERVILSGASVTIPVLLHNTADNKLYTLLVQQPRIGSGKLTLEFPAGFLDDTTDYLGSAVRELDEECGLTVAESELIDLGEFFICPAMFDERVYVCVLVRSVSAEEIRRYEGREGGVDEEEQIVAKVCLFDDVAKVTTDGTTLAAYGIVQAAIRERKVRLPL
jgi:8-oxo-dGTP pyrophosphatase MutT (NUDIX family)